MKNENGITLIIVLITVILLCIIGGLATNYGINTYGETKVLKFETYMKAIQKKVDLIMDEGTDYSTIGSLLTQQQINDLLEIIQDTENPITTSSEEVNNTNVKLRYFSSQDIANIFDIPDLKDEIVINFDNREVISLNGINKNGQMHYILDSLYR